MILRVWAARSALAVGVLGWAALVFVLLVVATPLQEIGFRTMALAGISVPVTFGLALVITGAGALLVAAGPRPVPRHSATVVVAAVLLAWLSVLVVAGPSTLGIARTRPADREHVPAADQFTVAVQNVWFRDPDPEALAATVFGRDPDVVVLVEYTEAHEAAWNAEAGSDYPYRWSAPAERGDGMALFSRFPIGRVERINLYAGAARTPIRIGGSTVDLVMVHPMAPSSFWGLQRWTSDMLELTRAGAEVGRQFGPRTVVVGDFNGTVHHRRFRELTGIFGLADALDVNGAGYAATWPGRGRLPPLMRLDHILVGSDIAVIDAEVVPAPGSDHLGVVARLGVAEP